MIGGMFWDFAWRLLLAGVLGAVIGLDREYRAKEAGFRTHFLVALGSALFMIVSQYGFSGVLAGADVKLDPSRVAAQGRQWHRLSGGGNHHFPEAGRPGTGRRRPAFGLRPASGWP